jgi:hypothetical protein
MNHFEMNDWADFVRGLASLDNRFVMERHLSSGCPSCREIAATLGRVAAVSKEDAEFQVPSHLVHNARAIFALQKPGRSKSLIRIVSQLRYDSFEHASPAGVRSRNQFTRQALYQAENYSLDLRLEHRPGAARVTLVGQVTNQDEPGKPLASVPVFLMVGRKIIGQAIGNSFGEFQVQYEPSQRLQLHVQPESGVRKQIVVPLRRFTPDEKIGLRRPRRKSAGRGKAGSNCSRKS